MPYDTPPPKKVPEPGYYYHYKHDPQKGVADYAYYIYGVGSHTEEYAKEPEKFFQVYRPLYESFAYTHGKMFDLRPVHMFFEAAEWQGKEVERFTRIIDPSVIAELREIKRRMYPED